jgi:hypothetical protein
MQVIGSTWNLKKFVHPHLNSKIIVIHSSREQLSENAKRFLTFDNSIALTKDITDGGIGSFTRAYNPSTSVGVVINTSLPGFASFFYSFCLLCI